MEKRLMEEQKPPLAGRLYPTIQELLTEFFKNSVP
jgi:hypothetical protein